MSASPRKPDASLSPEPLQAADAAAPVAAAAPAVVPPENTNERVLYDIAQLVPSFDAQRFRLPLIAAESVKVKELVAGGWLLDSAGIEFNNGKPPLELDQIARPVFHTQLRAHCKKSLTAAQLAAVTRAGLLATPPAPRAAAKRKIAEATAADASSDDDDGDGAGFEWTCDQVRRRITALVDLGEMNRRQAR